MEVVEMVLGGRSTRSSLIGEAGGQAIGLTGTPGAPERVDVSLIRTLTKDGFIPVIAPVGVDAAGDTYNVNADTAAGAIAEALAAEKLMLLTDVEGVLDNDKHLIAHMSEADVRSAIGDGTVKGGMIPKLECAVHALEHGVTASHIIDGGAARAPARDLHRRRRGDEGVCNSPLSERPRTSSRSLTGRATRSSACSRARSS
jgi:acetylglutamate kinase